MTDHAESYEERMFREQAEDRARLERALTRLDSGLSGGDLATGLDRLARYMRIQIGEDDRAWSEHASFEGGFGPAEGPAMRTTRMQDRTGLELAIMLLTGER